MLASLRVKAEEMYVHKFELVQNRVVVVGVG